MKRKKIIIGLVGPPGAGKTSVASYLVKQGFFAIRLSSFLEEEVKKRYGELSRRGLQDVGNEFRKRHGPSILAKWAIEKAEAKKRIVIDGLRNLAEVNFLKKEDDFFLLGITAKPEIRFKRLAKVKGKSQPSWSEFLRLDARDKGRGQSRVGLQISKCLEKVDCLLENNQTLASLFKKVTEFLKSL